MAEPITIVARSAWASSVPTKTVLVQLEIPVDKYIGLGEDPYYLHTNVDQCGGAAYQAIAEYIYGCPVEWVDGNGEYDGSYRPVKQGNSP